MVVGVSPVGAVVELGDASSGSSMGGLDGVVASSAEVSPVMLMNWFDEVAAERSSLDSSVSATKLTDRAREGLIFRLGELFRRGKFPVPLEVRAEVRFTMCPP